MRITAHTIKELDEQLRQHPAIRRLQFPASQAGTTPRIESASSLRTHIRSAMAADPRIGSLVTNARRVAQCRDEGRALLRKSIVGERASERSVREFSKKWAGIEHDYQSVVDLSYELTSSNKALAAFAQAAKDIDDVHRFANPAFLDKSQQVLLREMGTDVSDLMDAYRHAYLPDRKRLDQAIEGVGSSVPMEGREHIKEMVFLYAPERMLEGGVLTLSGGDLTALSLAILAAAAALAWAIAEMERTVAAMMSAPWFLFLVLWWIWMDQQQRIAWLNQHTMELQQQYDDELRLLDAAPSAATVEETPAAVATEFGYVIGNISRSKLEVHVPNCTRLYAIRADHLRTLETLADARAAGLDNCYYCIGGSMR